MNYNLGVLNDKEFEQLGKDLLEKELGVKLQNFKKGKDKGTDLRHAGTKGNAIVVQVKHYPASKFSDLKYQLLTKELPKLRRMSPNLQRYIVFTSLGLNPDETDILFNGLQPFVLSTDDIYGRDRVESLLSNAREIEEKYYKLWLTSKTVLDRVLHNAIKGRSLFFQEKILNKVGLYVRTNNYGLAEAKLKANHFVIISGAPGIGKSTIAYLLICNFLANDYELIYVDDKLRDAEDLLSPDPEAKQVIFYDDFLGANIMEINNPRNTESAIVGFIERLQFLKNKFLILTTRTTILNQAIRDFEKFKRNRLGTISKYEVQLENYDMYAKAQILYNHLFQAGVNDQLYDVFVTDKNYLKIIEHKNYSPRLIEFITQMNNFNKSSTTDFKEFIFNNLENPEEIWRDAYERQLADEDRFLLLSLFSLGGYQVRHELLERAFESRYYYEITQNGFHKQHQAFRNALQKLLDGFVVSFQDSKSGVNYLSFLNPSVGDFLLNYVKNSHEERTRILYSAAYARQFYTFFDPSDKEQIHLTPEEIGDFFPQFQLLSEHLLPVSKESVAVEVIYIYLLHFRDRLDAPLIEKWLDQLAGEDIKDGQFARLLYSLETLATASALLDKVRADWDHLMNQLLEWANSSNELKGIVALSSLYEMDLAMFLSDDKKREKVQLAVNRIAQQIGAEQDFSWKIDDVIESYYSGDKQKARDMVDGLLWDVFSDLLTECGLDDFYEDFANNADLNQRDIFETLIENYGPSDYEPDHFEGSGSGRGDVIARIDHLFER